MNLDNAALFERVDELLDDGRLSEARALLEPFDAELLLDQHLAARWLLISDDIEDRSRVETVATSMLAAFSDDAYVLTLAANVLVRIAEARPFDEAPVANGTPAMAADALRRAWTLLPQSQRDDVDTQASYDCDIAMALRMTGSHDDAEALTRMQRVTALTPDDPEAWYKLGLLHKWRGRWRDGVIANQRALDLGSDTQAVRWNLMICATGAGDAELALELNRSLGAKMQGLKDGRPFGLYHPVQVRASTAGEGVDPAAHVVGATPQFENLWIERLSLCHGIVTNATVSDLPVDYGDVVLFDGAPVGYRIDGDHQVPRFPLLQRLEKGAYHRFWFIAQQPRTGTVDALKPGDRDQWGFYVHDEQVRWVCHDCATNGNVAHEHDQPTSETPHIVTGKLIVSHATPLREVASIIRAAARNETYIAVPDLFHLLGDHEGLTAARALWEQLEDDVLVPPTQVPEAAPPKAWWRFW